MTSSVLITVSGKDRPGVTGALFTVLAGHGVAVLDVEQVVVRGMLTLGVLVAAPGDPEAVQEAVEQAMASIGLSVAVSVGTPTDRAGRRPTHLLVVLGRPLTARAIALLARRFGETGVNIESIRRIADYPVTGLELAVSAADDAALRRTVADIGAVAGVDIAVERSALERRSKRLIVFDVDSTLITGEVIEMLAERVGQRAAVERITAAAMHGDLDFAAALRARVALLAGLDAAVLDEIGASLELTPGARTTVRTLKRLGYRCGIVSGGFSQVTRHLVADLGLDFAAANTLEVLDGRLTGALVGDIVDRAGKARALARFADESGVPMSQTVAVGDGANDIDMLTAAGLGIAFNAKPVVAEHADTTLNQPFLDPVLFILGIARDEVEAADAADGVLHRVPVDSPSGGRVSGSSAPQAVASPSSVRNPGSPAPQTLEFARSTAAVDGVDPAPVDRTGPTGAALAPLRERYASWLDLDEDGVRADREEDPDQVRALQLILHLERDPLPSWHAAVALAARASAAVCLDPRSEPGGEWYDAVLAYCTGHIRKVTRRARAGHWAATAELPGITLSEGVTEVRALVPGLVFDLDKRVSRLQVGGTDVPRDPSPFGQPEPRPLVPELRVWLNPTVTMTLGKAMAQAGHAGMIAAALLAGTDPAALARWARSGLPTRARVHGADAFAGLCDALADPEAAWREHGLLAVRDAGFTEIDPGTITVVALAPRGR